MNPFRPPFDQWKVRWAIHFNWSPRLEFVSPLEDPRGNFIMFFWPSLAAAWVTQATQARMMRSTMLEVLRQDYIRTAHAKGLRYFVVVYRHALKNALLPVVTIVGITVALILGGTVIIETIFQLPGLSRYLVQSLQNWDYTVVQTVVLFLSIWIVAANLVVDLTYGWLDPRSLSEKQCSKRYASLVECKDANYSTAKSRLL